MLFNSQQYLLFFLAVFSLYWAVPRQQQKLRVWLLIVASFIFYASYSSWLACLVAGTTVLDYLLARGIEASPKRFKGLFLVTSLGINLGLLCAFKYYNFFLDSYFQALAAAGYPARWDAISILVPFGISFYTFEAISYTIDVYRGRIKAERSLPNFMLFILFFPHLVAGPIVRAYDFIPQTHMLKRFSWPRVQLGVQHFLLGLFLKVAVADRMAYFVDPIFGNPSQPETWLDAAKYNTSAIWLAVLAFTIQIYTDFCGYSHMALGSAHLLGYKLTRNFNMPYVATNIQEFWHRWHISLSTWFRDYVFIPLGGSRGGFFFVTRNILIVFVLSGLWHGANWTFVVWGALHGLLLIAHRGWRKLCQGFKALDGLMQTYPMRVLSWALTFYCVAMLWVFFRASSFESALTIFERMFTLSPGMTAPLHNRSLWYTVAVLVAGHLLTLTGWWRQLAPRVPAPAMGFAYAALLTLTLLLAPDSDKAFIYFNF